MNRENENGENLESRLEPELEARLVAWIAGEASEFEQAELEKLVKARPELARFKERIELVRELVREAARPDAEPLRLSAERRAKLLKTLGANAEVLPLREQVVVLPPKPKWWQRREARIYLVTGGMAAGFALALLNIARQQPIFEERAELHFEREKSESVVNVQGVVDTNIRSNGGGARVSRYVPAPAAGVQPMEMPAMSGQVAKAVVESQELAQYQSQLQQARQDQELRRSERRETDQIGQNQAPEPNVRFTVPGVTQANGASSGDTVAVNMPATTQNGAEARAGGSAKAASSGLLSDVRGNVDPEARPGSLLLSATASNADLTLQKSQTQFADRPVVQGKAAQSDAPAELNLGLVTGAKDLAASARPARPDPVTIGGATVHGNAGAITLGGTLSPGKQEDEGYLAGGADAGQTAAVTFGGSSATTRGAPVGPAAAASAAPVTPASAETITLSAFTVQAPESKKRVATKVGAERERAVARVGAVTAPATPAPAKDEIRAAEQAVSTFSLHVSDVSFRLASTVLAALERGEQPGGVTLRAEEFYNAFDYGDPFPTEREKVTARTEQARHPSLQQRNLLRIALRVAATGRAANQGLRLTVLLDTSGSMEREDRRAAVRRAMAELVALLGPNDRVTLIGFARQPRLLAENVAGDRARDLVRLAAETPADGGTNLEEALKLAGEVALRNRSEGAQNRIVLLTDGAANLGSAEPARLMTMVERLRERGLAFDACGVGLEGVGDTVLEAMTRKGDGRYYVLDQPEAADAAFARKLAGAFRPAAENVKVQVRFNPARVGAYRLIGFEQHRLNAEDFRNDKIDAAELSAEEAAVAMYQVEPLPQGSGDVGEVSVRFRDPATGEMVERTWMIPYEAAVVALDRATPSMQLAGVAAMMGEVFTESAVGRAMKPADLARTVNQLRGHFPNQPRVRELVTMFERARQLARE